MRDRVTFGLVAVETIGKIIQNFYAELHFPEIFTINNDNTLILYISSTLVKTCRKLASKYTSLAIICLIAQATLTEPTRSSTCSLRCCRSASWPAPAPGDYSHDDGDDNGDMIMIMTISGSPTTCVAVSRSLNTSSGRMW